MNYGGIVSKAAVIVGLVLLVLSPFGLIIAYQGAGKSVVTKPTPVKILSPARAQLTEDVTGLVAGMNESGRKIQIKQFLFGKATANTDCAIVILYDEVADGLVGLVFVYSNGEWAIFPEDFK